MNAPEPIHRSEGATPMESKLRRRLEELRAEFDKGQQTLHDLEAQAANVRATLLRISGAIQVLSEALGEPAPEGVVLAPPSRLPPG
jgi:predicted nuclease with TOPRIM domain